MFTVSGMIDSVPYRVGVHPEPIEGERYECVMGSDHATNLLAAHVGDETRATPTHGAVTLSLSDPASVLAFLREHTDVREVSGDAPVDDNSPGTIY